jgi:hypothetical protein
MIRKAKAVWHGTGRAGSGVGALALRTVPWSRCGVRSFTRHRRIACHNLGLGGAR